MPILSYCQIVFPKISSKVTVFNELNYEKVYKNCSFLPNVNPRCPQLLILLPMVFLYHMGILENDFGSNLKKCYPKHDEDDFKFVKTYA
jgi:hypothetical protein